MHKYCLSYLFAEVMVSILACLYESTGSTTAITYLLDVLVKVFYVVGKVLSGELSCTRIGLVN